MACDPVVVVHGMACDPVVRPLRMPHQDAGKCRSVAISAQVGEASSLLSPTMPLGVGPAMAPKAASLNPGPAFYVNINQIRANPFLPRPTQEETAEMIAAIGSVQKWATRMWHAPLIVSQQHSQAVVDILTIGSDIWQWGVPFEAFRDLWPGVTPPVMWIYLFSELHGEQWLYDILHQYSTVFAQVILPPEKNAADLALGTLLAIEEAHMAEGAMEFSEDLQALWTDPHEGHQKGGGKKGGGKQKGGGKKGGGKLNGGTRRG